MQITISGDLGSGKSTLGEILAKDYNAELIDCGQLYRKYAAENGRDVLKQNKSSDISIDEQIDTEIIRLGKEGLSRIYVSRTAWHFIPNAVHVYLSVDPMLAAQRIAARKTVGEEHTDSDSVLLYNMERAQTEDARYLKMYGITREEQLRDAHVIMNIGTGSVEDVHKALQTVIPSSERRSYVISPKELIPTQVLRDMSIDIVSEYKQWVRGDVVELDLTLLRTWSGTYIVDGHHRVAAACLNDVKYIVAHEVTFEDDSLQLSMSDYFDWEDAWKVKLDHITKRKAELIWCKANAPEALGNLSAEQLLDVMHQSYVDYLRGKV